MKPLIDVVFMSEKRKEVLLLLQDGAKEMEIIHKTLDTTRQALLPQIKILEEHHLVFHDRDTYKLTTIGKLIVNEMSPLIDTVEVFDVDIDYWGTRSLDFIPSHLLRRMNELGKCTTIIPTITEIYNVHDRFYELSKKSTVHSVITTTFYPHFPKLLYELLPKNIHANVIVSNELFDKLRTESRTELVKFIDNELIHLFVYPENIGLLDFLYNEYCIMLSPLTNEGDFDNKHIECCNQGALKWGEELFEHYLKKSRPITEL
jgi:predicted transcriptional regulator